MYALAVGFALLFALHGALSIFLIARPGYVLAAIADYAASRRLQLGVVARIPPYPWLLGGRRWDAFVELGTSQPEAFPRMVRAIRILGGLSLGVNLSIVFTILLLTLLE